MSHIARRLPALLILAVVGASGCGHQCARDPCSIRHRAE
jgi:hypothetical protein